MNYLLDIFLFDKTKVRSRYKNTIRSTIIRIYFCAIRVILVTYIFLRQLGGIIDCSIDAEKH